MGGASVITTAKDFVAWPAQEEIGPLKVVFDAIHLEQRQTETHYWPAWAITNTDNAHDPRKQYPRIPYPSTQAPSQDQIQTLKQKVKAALEALTTNDWHELSLLILVLEKYGSYLSFGQPDVAFFDQVKATAAVAAALGENPEATQLCLISADLSGIQDFIYTISSDGALKSLRARSFTLELVTEEIVQQLLTRLALPRSNVIYAGGGNLYLLAPVGDAIHETVKTLRYEVNHWLLKEYQGKVFLSLTSLNFDRQDVGTRKLAHHWQAAIEKLSVQKSQKFDQHLDQHLMIQPAHEPCKVCHRDDVETLKPLDGQDGVDACPTCCQMFERGQKLFKVGALVRSTAQQVNGALARVDISIGDRPIYYHLFEEAKTIPLDPKAVYLINNWDVDLYKFRHFKNPTPLLLGNYGQASDQETGYITAQEMAENKATGIKRVGYLRMDVDKLGQIFAKGLGDNYSLPRLAGLSRQISYFFKVYLNSLAEYRDRDFLAHRDHYNFQALTESPRQDLLFIYAGGDDLFVSGAWDQVTEFAFDVYQSFRAFTGQHPDITLSAGISLSGPKYPLYQSAADSGRAESAAKGHGRDSLGLFDQIFKWREWLGSSHQTVAEIDVVSAELRRYLGDAPTLALFGIFPFVDHLQETLGTQYSRSFIRNLISTAQIQEQWIKKAKKEKSGEEQAIRYFLHLPRVAYTLARVPNAVKTTEGFDAVRTSLKSPYNAPYFRAIATWLDLLNR
ncbi:MAG: type III-A CRISPR-associated protein Cas10/Csm1 [Kaiparowitsia implicata GSE-PSE-MK54-09C]|nr:type III-A CRISPR-associated protein Cas10/Csm1 [Kaiparowitsia implicata GSE-PSE-MK54-09C]